MRCLRLTRFPRLLVLFPVLALCSLVPALLADDPPADKTAEKRPTIGPPIVGRLLRRQAIGVLDELAFWMKRLQCDEPAFLFYPGARLIRLRTLSAQEFTCQAMRGPRQSCGAGLFLFTASG
jgi:hypothetical protein